MSSSDQHEAEKDIKDVILDLRRPPRTGIRSVCLQHTPEHTATQLGSKFFVVWKNRIYYANENGSVTASKHFSQDEVHDMMDSFDLTEFGDYIAKLLEGGKAMWPAWVDRDSTAPLEVISRGVEIRTAANKMAVLVTSLRVPTYFDLGIMKKDGDFFCYSRLGKPACHSGDRGFSLVTEPNGPARQHLVQFGDGLDGHARLGETLVVFVCGYSKTPLKQWSERRPSVTFMDDYGHKFLLPLSLSPADVGNNTGMSIARMTRTARGWIVEPTVDAATSTTTTMPPDHKFINALKLMCCTPAILASSGSAATSAVAGGAIKILTTGAMKPLSLLPDPPKANAVDTLMVFTQEGGPPLFTPGRTEIFPESGSLPFAGMVTMSFASLLCEGPQCSLPHIHVFASTCSNVETSHVPHVGKGFNGVFVCFKDIEEGDVIESTNMLQMMTALGPRGVLVVAFYKKDDEGNKQIQHYRYVMGYLRDQMVTNRCIPTRSAMFTLETMAAVFANELDFGHSHGSGCFQDVGEDAPCPVDLQPCIDSLHSLDAITFENKLALTRLLAEFNAFRINKGPMLVGAAHAIGKKLLSLVESKITALVMLGTQRNTMVKDLLKSVSSVIMHEDEQSKLDEFAALVVELASVSGPSCEEPLIVELGKTAGEVNAGDIKAVSSFLQSTSSRLANRKKNSNSIITTAIKSFMKPINEKLQEILHPLQFWAQRCPRWAPQYPKIKLVDLRGMVRAAEGKLSHGKVKEMTLDEFLMLTADTVMFKITADVTALAARSQSGQLEIDLGLLNPEELITIECEETQLMSPNDIAKQDELVILIFEVGVDDISNPGELWTNIAAQECYAVPIRMMFASLGKINGSPMTDKKAGMALMTVYAKMISQIKDNPELIKKAVFTMILIAATGQQPLSLMFQLFTSSPKINPPEKHELFFYCNTAWGLQFTDWSIHRKLQLLVVNLVYRNIVRVEKQPLIEERKADKAANKEIMNEYMRMFQEQFMVAYRDVIRMHRQFLKGELDVDMSFVAKVLSLDETLRKFGESGEGNRRYRKGFLGELIRMLVKAAKDYGRRPDALKILMSNKGYIDMMSKCVIGKYREYDDYLVRKLLQLVSKQPRDGGDSFTAKLQEVKEEVNRRDDWVKEHRPTSAPMTVFKDRQACDALIQKIMDDPTAPLRSSDLKQFSRKMNEYRQAWHMAKDTEVGGVGSDDGYDDGSSGSRKDLMIRGTAFPAMSLVAMHEYAAGSNVEKIVVGTDAEFTDTLEKILPFRTDYLHALVAACGAPDGGVAHLSDNVVRRIVDFGMADWEHDNPVACHKDIWG